MPKRIRSLLPPRLWTAAARASVTFGISDELPETEGALEFITSYTGARDEYMELYAFTAGSDIDLLMTVWVGVDGETYFEFGRMTTRKVEIFIDDISLAVFDPYTGGVGNGYVLHSVAA